MIRLVHMLAGLFVAACVLLIAARWCALSLLHRGRIVIALQTDCGPVATLRYRNRYHR
jgi:hypothetical protein